MHLHQPAATKRGGDPQRMLICLEVLSTKPFRGNETPAELIDRSLAHDMHVTVTARTIRALARAERRVLRRHRTAPTGVFGRDEHGEPLMQGNRADAIDYSNPTNLISLLFDRGWRIMDRPWIARAVAADPGPIYYPDIDRDEHGLSWPDGGDHWTVRLSQALNDAGAIEQNIP
jgi:hypothetical protein